MNWASCSGGKPPCDVTVNRNCSLKGQSALPLSSHSFASSLLCRFSLEVSFRSQFCLSSLHSYHLFPSCFLFLLPFLLTHSARLGQQRKLLLPLKMKKSKWIIFFLLSFSFDQRGSFMNAFCSSSFLFWTDMEILGDLWKVWMLWKALSWNLHSASTRILSFLIPHRFTSTFTPLLCSILSQTTKQKKKEHKRDCFMIF